MHADAIADHTAAQTVTFRLPPAGRDVCTPVSPFRVNGFNEFPFLGATAIRGLSLWVYRCQASNMLYAPSELRLDVRAPPGARLS